MTLLFITTPKAGFYLPLAFFLLLLTVSCDQDSSGKARLVPEPEQNPGTEAGIALGRMLFYDPALSENNRLSCATCHAQALAFTDGEARTTRGASGRMLDRHAPALFNLAWMQKGLFWDGGAKNLESLSLGPLRHPDEMNTNLKTLPAELAQQPAYPPRFEAAFGTDTITVAAILRALAQFQRSIVSFSAKYDRVQRGEATFTPLEKRGYAVYQKNCAGCHSEGLFTDNEFHNNGLDATFPTDWENPRQGRFRITLDTADLGKYKTPSLRNLAFTAPYMHDGRFKTLQQVLDHYADSIRLSPSLDERLKGGIPLTTSERRALVAFLKTLNDSSLVENEAYSNPF